MQVKVKIYVENKSRTRGPHYPLPNSHCLDTFVLETSGAHQPCLQLQPKNKYSILGNLHYSLLDRKLQRRKWKLEDKQSCFGPVWPFEHKNPILYQWRRGITYKVPSFTVKHQCECGCVHTCFLGFQTHLRSVILFAQFFLHRKSHHKEYNKVGKTESSSAIITFPLCQSLFEYLSLKKTFS